MAFVEVIGTLTILAGQNVATQSLSQSVYAKYAALSFIPSGNLTGTATLRGIAVDAVSSSANWATVKSPAGNVVTVTAGNSAYITHAPYDALQFSSSVVQAARTSITVVGQIGVVAAGSAAFA